MDPRWLWLIAVVVLVVFLGLAFRRGRRDYRAAMAAAQSEAAAEAVAAAHAEFAARLSNQVTVVAGNQTTDARALLLGLLNESGAGEAGDDGGVAHDAASAVLLRLLAGQAVSTDLGGLTDDGRTLLHPARGRARGLGVPVDGASHRRDVASGAVTGGDSRHLRSVDDRGRALWSVDEPDDGAVDVDPYDVEPGDVEPWYQHPDVVAYLNGPDDDTGRILGT